MTGFLRFAGILNAAVWLGAALFLFWGAEGAMFSPDAQGLLQKSFPYLSGLLAQAMRARFCYWSMVCGALAGVHLLAEWLYLGRVRKFSLGLLATLVAVALLSGCLLQPRLRALHVTRTAGATAAERQAAQQAMATWQIVSQAADLLLLCGLTAYLWRMTNPPDTLRVLNAAKFRG